MPRVYLDGNNFIYEDVNLTPLTTYVGNVIKNIVLPNISPAFYDSSYSYNRYVVTVDRGSYHGATLPYGAGSIWDSILSGLNASGEGAGPVNLKLEGVRYGSYSGDVLGKMKIACFICLLPGTLSDTYDVAYGFMTRIDKVNYNQTITTGVYNGGYAIVYGDNFTQLLGNYYDGHYDQAVSSLSYSEAVALAISLKNSIQFPCWVNTDLPESGIDLMKWLTKYRNSTEGQEMDLWLRSDEGWNMTEEWTKPRSILDCINAYVLTDTRLKRFQDGLWYTDGMADVKFSNGLYANPMECILGLNFIPFDPSGNIGSLEDVVVGLQHIHYTGDPAVNLDATKLSNEYKEFDFGSKELLRVFNDYRDFTEVQCEIYLPCIGWHTLNSEEVMGKTLNVKYRVNFVTGDILAILSINGNIIDSIPGNCLQSIPYSGRDMTNLIGAQKQANANLMSIAAGVGTAAVGLGMAAAGNPLGLGMAAGGVGTVINGFNNVSNASNEVSKAQNQVQKSGSIGGSTGILGYPTPYIVMRTHTDVMPTGWEEYIGASSHKIATIGTLTGYVKTKNFRFSDDDCTQEEIDKINALMDGGVII